MDPDQFPVQDSGCVLLRKDLEYWMIDENWMDECCSEKYCGLRENVMEEMEISAAGLQQVQLRLVLKNIFEQIFLKNISLLGRRQRKTSGRVSSPITRSGCGT